MVYKCSICGYVYDEEKEGKPFSELTECPVCKQPPERFQEVETEKKTDITSEAEKKPASINAEGLDLSYPAQTRNAAYNTKRNREVHKVRPDLLSSAQFPLPAAEEVPD